MNISIKNCGKIDNKLKAIYVDIFDEIDKRTSGKNIFYRTEAEQQIKDMYEVYWAAIPYFESEYVICRKKVEQLLNGRKTTRNFNQVTAKDSGKKMPREAMLRNPRSTVSVNR